MKKIILFSCLFVMLTGSRVFSQNVATVKVSDLSIEANPGTTNKIKVTVTNTQNTAIIKYKSDYMVTMVYKGSGDAETAFNKEVSLGDPLDPGKYRDIELSYTGPSLPGEYDVEIYLKWGNKPVSNILRATITIEGVYDVALSCQTLSLSVKRGGTSTVPLRFKVSNIGRTAWPEGNYSIHFSVVSSPSGASSYDKAAFNISPNELESWDMQPGDDEDYVEDDFKPPFTEGSYVVTVSVYRDGKPFNAKGATKNFTFKVNVD